MTRVTLHKVKRKRGASWVLRWFGNDGRRYGEAIGDARTMPKRDAEAERRAKQGKLDCRVESPDRPGAMTLDNFLKRDRQAVAVDLKPRTIAEMETAAKHAAGALGADLDVRKIDRAAVGRFKQYLADRKLSAATIVKNLTHLQGAFSRGMADNLVTGNPFLPRSKRRPHGIRRPKVQQKPVQTYKPHELEALLAVAPDLWWATFIRLAYTSGLREGELLNLLWAEVDLDGRTVTDSMREQRSA